MIGANSLGLPTVALDEVAASQKAIKHLLDLGHRRIAIVSGPHTSSTGLNHLQGYMRVLAEAHIPYRAELVLTGDYTAKAGYRAGQKLARLPDRQRPFCGNDLMALGLMRAMREADLRIPADISVVGYNKIPSLQYGYIEPTSFKCQPLVSAEQPCASCVRRKNFLKSGSVTDRIILGESDQRPLQY